MITEPENPEANVSQPRRRSALEVLWRGLRLKCPKCGQGRIFRGWFTMNERCSECGRLFERAPGYLLGSIYMNYGLTAALMMAGYFILDFSGTLRGTPLLATLTALIVVFPLWFFRYARSLWIAFDERWDPYPNDEEARRDAKLRSG
ncbi:MAG TPA: DUF983 domain-containing protein [Lacipirellula sp.]